MDLVVKTYVVPSYEKAEISLNVCLKANSSNLLLNGNFEGAVQVDSKSIHLPPMQASSRGYVANEDSFFTFEILRITKCNHVFHVINDFRNAPGSEAQFQVFLAEKHEIPLEAEEVLAMLQ